MGTTCLRTMRMSRAPSERAASTKSRSRIPATEPRATRAKAGIVQIPIAMTVLVRPGPSALTMMMASSRYGNASSTSMTRMIRVSTQPPT